MRCPESWVSVLILPFWHFAVSTENFQCWIFLSRKAALPEGSRLEPQPNSFLASTTRQMRGAEILLRLQQLSLATYESLLVFSPWSSLTSATMRWKIFPNSWQAARYLSQHNCNPQNLFALISRISVNMMTLKIIMVFISHRSCVCCALRRIISEF